MTEAIERAARALAEDLKLEMREHGQSVLGWDHICEEERDMHRRYREDGVSILRLAEAAVERMKMRENEDIDKWACRLAADLVAAGEKEYEMKTAPSAEALELGAKAYGFVTMPDPVTLSTRQLEIIEGCARAIDAAYRRGWERGREDAIQANLAESGKWPAGKDESPFLNVHKALRALAPPQEGS